MRFRNTVLWLIVLGVVSGGYFGLRYTLKPREPVRIFIYGEQYTDEDVVRIVYDSGITVVEVVFREGRYWSLNKETGEFSMPVKREKIREFFNGLNAVSVIQKVDTAGKDLEEWRLGKSAKKLFLTFPDSGKQEIYIGAENPADRGVFIKIGDDLDAIYLVSPQLKIATETVLFTLTDDRILLAEHEQILKIEIDSRKTEELRANAVTCTLMEGGKWHIEHPIFREADSEAVKDYLKTITKLRFDSLKETLHKVVGEQEPLLHLKVVLKGDKGEELSIYKGVRDIMDRKRFILLNHRTGLIGYVYPLVYNSINQTFVSFCWKRLFKGEPGRIERISLKRGRRHLTFVQSLAGEWIMVEYFDAPVDKKKMMTVIELLVNFRISEFVSNDVYDIEKCGLKYPVAILSIEEFQDENSRSYVYLFGNQVEGRNEIYFKEIDSNEIYTVDYEFLRFLSRPAWSYVSKKITEFDKKRVDRIKIITPAKTYKFSFSDIEGWFLDKPLLTRHIDNDAFNELLETVSGLTSQEIPVPEDIPVEAFDSRNILIEIEIHVKARRGVSPESGYLPEYDKDYLFAVSTMKNRNGRYYVKHKISNLIFTLEPAVIKVLQKEFVDRSVFIDDISNAAEIEIQYVKEDTKVVIKKIKDSWQLVEPHGKVVDERAVITYLRFLNSLKAEGVFLYKTDEKEREKLGFRTPLLKVKVVKGINQKYEFVISDIIDKHKNGLLRVDNEVYILTISSDTMKRIKVRASYFLLNNTPSIK